MTDPDTTQALDRIERALARIEAVEHAVAARRSPVEDIALVERHDRLRSRVQATIDRLDTLLAGQDG